MFGGFELRPRGGSDAADIRHECSSWGCLLAPGNGTAGFALEVALLKWVITWFLLGNGRWEGWPRSSHINEDEDGSCLPGCQTEAVKGGHILKTHRGWFLTSR